MPEQSPLQRALRADPPAGVAALPAEVQDRLADLVDEARRRQARLMTEAVETAIKGVPLPVRGVVKKALLG